MNRAPSKTAAKPLAGWRVLVPRGGPWGDSVAATLRRQGAVPVIAPLINFAPTTDQTELESALAALAAGDFDWVTLTSATTVDVLYAYRAVIPPQTKVAAVGETTAAALQAAKGNAVFCGCAPFALVDAYCKSSQIFVVWM